MDLGDDGIKVNEDMNGDFSSDYDDGFGFEGYGGVPTMEKHQELLKQLMNFDPYIKTKLNGWLGITWNEKRQRYERNPHIEPIMNIKGAAYFSTLLNTYARDNNMITHIGKEEYDGLYEDLIETVWVAAGTRAEEFGIKTQQYIDIRRVANEVCNSAELVLMGSGDGKTAKLLSETTTRTENVSQAMQPQQQQEQRRGLFGSIGNSIKKIFTGVN